MHYGEDSDPPRRVRKIEDIHVQEVMLRAAIMEEFKATFNIASLFADALHKVAPDHPLIHVAKFEGMLGRFELKEINEILEQKQSPSVQTVHESGILSVPESQRDSDTGAGYVFDGEAPSTGDSVAQGSGSPDAQADGDGSSLDSDRGSEQIPISWGSGEVLADGSVPSVGESSE